MRASVGLYSGLKFLLKVRERYILNYHQ